MKSAVIGAWLLLAVAAAAAQQRLHDGAWLSRGIAAGQKIEADAKTDLPEFSDAIGTLAFVDGIMATHRRNNRLFNLMFATANGNGRAMELMRPTFEMVPLLLVPDQVTNLQVLAIMRKYLADNPQRLHEPADMLIVDALRAAYPLTK